MGFSFSVFIIFSCIWATIGGVIPIFVPKGANRGVIQTCLIISSVCCYLMWLITYMAQMNPLFGPQLTNSTNLLIQNNWSGS